MAITITTHSGIRGNWRANIDDAEGNTLATLPTCRHTGRTPSRVRSPWPNNALSNARSSGDRHRRWRNCGSQTAFVR